MAKNDPVTTTTESPVDPKLLEQREAARAELEKANAKLKASDKEIGDLCDARDEALNRVAELEKANARLVLKTAAITELTNKAAKLELGQSIVLEEDDDTEIVVLHRKRAPKPTGKFVPKCHYRFAVPATDEAAIAKLASEGAVIAGGADNTKVVSLRPHMKELAKGERAPAYSVPPDAAEHGVVAGALAEEVA